MQVDPPLRKIRKVKTDRNVLRASLTLTLTDMGSKIAQKERGCNLTPCQNHNVWPTIIFFILKRIY